MKTFLLPTLLLTAAVLPSPPARAGEFDRYGGALALQCSGGPKAHFYTEKIRSQWWLCTPLGNVFWALGVYEVGPWDQSADLYGVNTDTILKSRYANGYTGGYGGAYAWQYNYKYTLVPRLQSWGFNTLDMYADLYMYPWGSNPTNWPRLPDNTYTNPNKLPGWVLYKSTVAAFKNSGGAADSAGVKNIVAAVNPSVYKGWTGYTYLDYFDNRYAFFTDAGAAAVKPAINSDWVLGISSDDTDYAAWAGPGSDFVTQPVAGKSSPHGGWVTLVASPLQSYTVAVRDTIINMLYPDRTVYAKADARPGARSLRGLLVGRYGNIQALNAAWGASYTTFDSTATRVGGEATGTGDGVTKSFSHTLQRVPTKCSLQFLVAGKPAAGDNCTGQIYGPGISAGTVDYTTGAVSLTFITAPAAAQSITANYTSGGWGTGTGLMDEDGTCPAKGTGGCWVPISGTVGSGGTQRTMVLQRNPTSPQTDTQYNTVLADLDDVLQAYAEKYFQVNRDSIRSKFGDGYLYAGLTNIGSWGTPARAPVLKAVQAYLDVFRGHIPSAKMENVPDWQARFDYQAWYVDLPWTAWMGGNVCPSDGYFSVPPSEGRNSPCVGTSNWPTQFASMAERGTWYRQVLGWMMNNYQGGVRHFVGLNWWQLLDNRVETSNWGLMTRRANPYDGISAAIQPGTDAWGYATGGELRDFGDFLTPVAAVNARWTEAALQHRAAKLTNTKSRNLKVH